MKKLTLLLTFVLLGCATESKYQARLNSWLYRPKSELVLNWGVPDKTYKLDKNTELLAYKKETKIQGVKYWCKTTFTITNNDVSKWITEGNDCRSY